MPLESDLVLTRHSPYTGPAQVEAHYEKITPMIDAAPRWHKIGAAKLREMRWAGTAGRPAPTVLEGESSSVPSRDEGRTIPIRIFRPKSGSSDGVFLHYHGGGFVTGDERSFDPRLARVAEKCNLTTISVGYRKAPEDPFPAGPNDTYDATAYLVDNAEKMFGAHVKFLGGESAGGYMALQNYFSLAKSRPSFKLKGLLLWYGCFDLSGSPTLWNLKEDPLLTLEEGQKFMGAFVPNVPTDTLRTAEYSPLYHDLRGLQLPDALLIVGTKDVLFDESLFMTSKWLANGGQAILKIMSGCGHGFNGLGVQPQTKEAEEYEEIFVNERK